MPTVRRENPPPGFSQPTKLPSDLKEGSEWQLANSTWWEQHPMRYDWKEGINAPAQSEEFFAEIDRRFFETAQVFMPWRRVPFDSLIDFDSLGKKDVLEIGVGCGSCLLYTSRCV